jgi:hypothetical protein
MQQQTREIVLFFNAEGKEKTIQSAVSTLAELKKEVKDYDLSNKKIMEQTTRAVYEADESILPAGDFVLYIYPKKSKAGAASFSRITIEKLTSLDYKKLQEFGKYLKSKRNADIRVAATKNALIEQLRAWMIQHKWGGSTKTAGTASPEAAQMESEFATKTGRAGVAATPREDNGAGDLVESVRTSKEEEGEVTLEKINSKLNTIISKLDKMLGSERTATPATKDIEAIKRDAERMRSELSGVA